MVFVREYVSQEDTDRFKLDGLLNEHLDASDSYQHYWVIDKETTTWLLPIKRLNYPESLWVLHYKDVSIEIKLFHTKSGNYDLISIASNKFNNLEIIPIIQEALNVLGRDSILYATVKERKAQVAEEPMQPDTPRTIKKKVKFLDILTAGIIIGILFFIANEGNYKLTSPLENNASTAQVAKDENNEINNDINSSKFEHNLYAVILTSDNESAIYGFNSSKLSIRTKIMQNVNNFSSSAVDQQGNIYWGNRTENGIYKSSMDGANIQKIITLPSNTRPDGIAIDNENKTIYWTHWLYDKQYAELCSADLSGNNKKILLSDKSIMKSGGNIFYDYLYHNLYISDFLGKKIIVHDLHTKKSRNLTYSSQPEGIVVDYKNKKVIWNDSESDNISSIDLDGSNKKVLIQFEKIVPNPKALTIDPINERLIYSYRGDLNDVLANLTIKIESSNLDGTNRKVESITHDNEIRSLFFANKIYNDQNSKKISKEKRVDKISKHKYDIYSIVQTSNDTNGIFGINKEDLNKRTEILSFGTSLSSCRVDKNRNIYWSDYKNGAIYKADPDGINIRKIIGISNGHPQGIAIDNKGKKIFWSQWLRDKKHGEIWSADLSGNNKKRILSNKRIMESGGRIFYDYIYDKLYVSDQSGRRVISIDLKTNDVMKLAYSPQPGDIVIDYKNRKVIWSDTINDNISSINFDGSNKKTLIQFESKFSNPDSLTIDTINDRLVYDYGQIIETSNLDGTNRREEGFTHSEFIKSLFFVTYD
jgi:sugar lactone lactonase YvrE